MAAPSPQAAYVAWLSACTAAGWAGAPVTERVPVSSGLDRVTAEPVHARWPSPRFSCAAMDGIAIRAGSPRSAGHRAGQLRLAASSFTWVDTGSPMPDGTDTVVQCERVRGNPDGSVEITGPAPPGLNVRAVGEDFPAGQLLIPAGHRLRPADLAAVATAGHATVDVARGPVAAIIPTGDEIRPVGSKLGVDGVVDSNSLMLAARAGQVGALPVVSDVQPDEPDVIASQVLRAASSADLVLIIAGSSAGRRDHTAAVIARTGGLAVSGVAVRPGHPVLLGWAGTGVPGSAAPVIGIPGYPLAAAVIFELFAVPLLTALQGLLPADRAARQVRLACDWTSSPDVEDWVPVSLASGPAGGEIAGSVVATPGRRGAGAISRLVQADAWWPIPIGQGRFARGDLIEVQPLPSAPHDERGEHAITSGAPS